jgi:predicted O-methyltransferase YrrM
MNLTTLLQAQPRMHTGLSGQPHSWQLADDLLHFIDAHIGERARTLEIGAGVSTILFALKGAHHLCIVPAEDEVDRIKAFCREHAISLDNVRFELDRSDRCLPRLELDGLDLVLIDGAHGFPIPFLDWYYTAARLKIGGLLA